MIPVGHEDPLASSAALAGHAAADVRLSRTGTALVLRDLDDSFFRARLPEILRLERCAYEPTRRHTQTYLEYVVSRPGCVCLAALKDDRVVGFALAAPLENFPMKRGTQADEHWGRGDTLYSADIVVDDGHRDHGIARLLKSRQVELARVAGYRRVTGRNRVGVAVAMWRINLTLGAHVLQTLENEYMDDIGPRGCRYYAIDLTMSEEADMRLGGRVMP